MCVLCGILVGVWILIAVGHYMIGMLLLSKSYGDPNIGFYELLFHEECNQSGKLGSREINECFVWYSVLAFIPIANTLTLFIYTTVLISDGNIEVNWRNPMEFILKKIFRKKYLLHRTSTEI